MKITKQRLKEIIKEELSTYQEGGGDESVPGTDLGAVITDLVFSAVQAEKWEVADELMTALPAVTNTFWKNYGQHRDQNRTPLGNQELGAAIEKAMGLATQAKRTDIDDLLEKAHQTLMGI